MNRLSRESPLSIHRVNGLTSGICWISCFSLASFCRDAATQWNAAIGDLLAPPQRLVRRRNERKAWKICLHVWIFWENKEIYDSLGVLVSGHLLHVEAIYGRVQLFLRPLRNLTPSMTSSAKLDSLSDANLSKIWLRSALLIAVDPLFSRCRFLFPFLPLLFVASFIFV